MRNCAALLLLLAGCAGPGEVTLGAGREFRNGGFSASGGGEAGVAHGNGHENFTSAGAAFEFEEQDVDSLWLAWTIPLGPKQIEVVSRPLEPSFRTVVEEEKPLEEKPTVQWAELGIGLAMGMASLFGAQRGHRKLSERRARRKATR